MVSVLALSAIDRGFKPWSGQTKDYKIGICYHIMLGLIFRRIYIYIYIYSILQHFEGPYGRLVGFTTKHVQSVSITTKVVRAP
jgi:hypothetical protein